MKRISHNAELLLGTDIAATRRFLDWDKPDNTKFSRLSARLLHNSDKYVLRQRFGLIENVEKRTVNERKLIAQWFAGRFAAKEAAKKAWGPSLVSWKDIYLERPAGGPPVLVCSPFPYHSATKVEQTATLSISHDGDYTLATVIASPLDSVILTELKRRKAEADQKIARTADSSIGSATGKAKEEAEE